MPKTIVFNPLEMEHGIVDKIKSNRACRISRSGHKRKYMEGWIYTLPQTQDPSTPDKHIWVEATDVVTKTKKVYFTLTKFDPNTDVQDAGERQKKQEEEEKMEQEKLQQVPEPVVPAVEESDDPNALKPGVVDFTEDGGAEAESEQSAPQPAMRAAFSGKIIVASAADVLTHDMLYAPTTIQSRYCPGMPGVQLQYIGNGQYANPITGEIYDFTMGFKYNGKFWGGGSISGQTNADSDQLSNVPHEPMMFRRVE